VDSWFDFERRWCRALLVAILPDGELPGIGAIDLEPFRSRLSTHAPPLLRFGLRASTWLLIWLPMLDPRALRPLHRLPRHRADAFLARAAGSRLYPLRQAVLAAKTIACFALLHDDDVRRRVDARSRPC